MHMDLTFTTVVLHGYNLPAYASLQKGVVDRCRVSAQPEKRSVQSKQKLLGFGSEIGLTLKKKELSKMEPNDVLGADSMLSPKTISPAAMHR